MILGSLDSSRRAARFDYKNVMIGDRLTSKLVESENIYLYLFELLNINFIYRSIYNKIIYFVSLLTFKRYLKLTIIIIIINLIFIFIYYCLMYVHLFNKFLERLFIFPSCNYKYPSLGGDPIVPYDCEWGPNKEARVNEIASTITSDFLILFRKNFHFPNDVVTIVPKRSDRASLPPPGYLTVSETHLRAGLRFPPPAELIEILQWCGVNLSQFSFRAMSVTVGLIALFRDRGATLTPEHLSRMGRFTSDTHGRVTFRSKWLDLRTRDPSKNWANAFFFVKIDWGLLEKWGKMKDLPSPLHVEEEDIMRILKVPDIEHLLFEVRHMSRYIEEEFLFKVGMLFHAGRSDAKMLKPTSKVLEPLAPTSKVASKRSARGEDQQVLKKKRLEEARATITQLLKDQKASKEKIASLEAKDKRSRTLIAEKEAALSGSEPSKVIEDFKKSIAFKTIIQDHVQEARDHIYDIECIEDGFIWGFLKGVRLMQRKTGVQVEGVTPSHASDDFPSGSNGDEIESELQKAFDLDVDDETANIE
ncbi:hypothetical protein IEQ34_020242 [Dendrobium chrysotoxum]|uniref:Uncharacterized protein n=1 Tax=Dendrobium chrysotoxum TaxID=161865 RepID=A0AAV7FKG2_DENCH|nr:hypothetical protein IEQ34_020242 [Dendrobium chrysotoxum]